MAPTKKRARQLPGSLPSRSPAKQSPLSCAGLSSGLVARRERPSCRRVQRSLRWCSSWRRRRRSGRGRSRLLRGLLRGRLLSRWLLGRGGLFRRRSRLLSGCGLLRSRLLSRCSLLRRRRLLGSGLLRRCCLLRSSLLRRCGLLGRGCLLGGSLLRRCSLLGRGCLLCGSLLGRSGLLCSCHNDLLDQVTKGSALLGSQRRDSPPGGLLEGSHPQRLPQCSERGRELGSGCRLMPVCVCLGSQCLISLTHPPRPRLCVDRSAGAAVCRSWAVFFSPTPARRRSGSR